jgi:tetratricopeptide (TPR) repeat protein
LTQRLKAWDVTPRDGRRAGVDAQFTQLSPSVALDDGRTAMRQFLIALLDLRLGDTASAARLAGALDAVVDSDSLGSLAHDYAATIEASLTAGRGDAGATLRALETQRFIIMNYRFIWPFHSHGVARMLRASALAQAGREEEALGWLDGLTTTELSVLDRQFLRAPAYRLAGEIYDRRGDRENALRAYSRFVTLWRDGEPSAQEQVKAVRERMAALAADN